MSRELRMAAKAGNIAKIIELLDQGDDINDASRDGWTALHHALRSKNADVVRLLLERGADVNVDGDGGDSLLLGATEEIRALLLQYGAKPKPRWNISIAESEKILRRASQGEEVLCGVCKKPLFLAYPGVTTREQIVAFARLAHVRWAEQIEKDAWIHPGLYCPNGCFVMTLNVRLSNQEDDA